MNNTFVLALGLAAIDGLTSAFVAMLILALAVIGSGQPAEVEANSESVWISIWKPSVKFLVIVEPVCGGPKARRIPQDHPSMQRLREIESQTQQGTINWIDSCSAEDERCSAQLLISRPKGKSWRIYLASANTQRNFTEQSIGPPIDVSILLATSSGQLVVKEKWPIDDNWHGFEFSVTGTPNLQKVEPFKC